MAISKRLFEREINWPIVPRKRDVVWLGPVDIYCACLGRHPQNCKPASACLTPGLTLNDEMEGYQPLETFPGSGAKLGRLSAARLGRASLAYWLARLPDYRLRSR